MTKKDLEQWYFRITDYAQRLLDDLATIDWPEQIKLMQTNWIGRSEGAEVDFGAAGPRRRAHGLHDAARHALRRHLHGAGAGAPAGRRADDAGAARGRGRPTRTRRGARARSSACRTEKEKTGVFTGAYAVNPVNDAPVPIWIGDYVLMGYGTGAIMAVPAHDERDFQFATAVRAADRRGDRAAERARRARSPRPTPATASW